MVLAAVIGGGEMGRAGRGGSQRYTRHHVGTMGKFFILIVVVVSWMNLYSKLMKLNT